MGKLLFNYIIVQIDTELINDELPIVQVLKDVKHALRFTAGAKAFEKLQ